MAKKVPYMNSEALIKSIKLRAMIPESQNTFTAEGFLEFADEEMALGLVPSILVMHEDYLMYTEKVPLEQNKIRYAIPYRAIGNKLRDVAFEDGSGNVYQMTRISIGDISYYNNTSNGSAYAFYVENNEIVLAPKNLTPATNTYLRMTYYMSPNQLVPSDQVAVVGSIDRTSGVVQFSNMPVDFNITELVDIIKVKSPNKTLKYDIQPVSINAVSKTITFNLADIPDTLAPGDHVALAQECCIPQVPSDLHVVLAHRVATRCLEALGDTEGLQNANQKLAEMEAKTTMLIDNRVEDSPQKIVNRSGFLRNGFFNRGRFGR